MQIVLSKDSDVPLRQQLTEQIVFMITTGQLHAGDELPSVRALGRQMKVHHNTVSESYQELVRRGWLTRRPGSRLVVGLGAGQAAEKPDDLDDLINETIQRARAMGYPLQALRLHVRERLLAEPADHLLVIEREPGLRELLRTELEQSMGWVTQACSPEDFAAEPGLAIGAQVLVARHQLPRVRSALTPARPPLGLVYSLAAEHVERIRRLELPSVIALVSVSPGLLKTAKSLFAPAIGKRHMLQEVLVADDEVLDLGGTDLAFCDTATLAQVQAGAKVHYRLIADDCLVYLRETLTMRVAG